MHWFHIRWICCAVIALGATTLAAQQPAPQPAPAPAGPDPRSDYTPAQPAPQPAAGSTTTGAGALTVEYKDSLEWFAKGYGLIAADLIFQGWGQWIQSNDESAEEDDGPLRQRFSPGLYLAGYGVLSESLHLGGFYSFTVGRLEIEEVELNIDDFGIDHTFMHNLGVTAKLGKPMSERIWIGGAVDLGLLLVKGDVQDWGAGLETKLLVGMSLHPRFNLDVMLVNIDAVKLALTATLGLFVVPVVAGHPFDTGQFNARVAEDKGRLWLMSIDMLIGLSVGV